MNDRTTSLKSLPSTPRSALARQSTRAKFLLAVPAAAAAATPVAHADITYTEINGGSGLSVGSPYTLFFNPVSGQASTSSIPFYFGLYFAFNSTSKPAIGSSTGSGVVSGVYAPMLGSGVLIDGSDTFNAYPLLASDGSGPWASGGNGYLGLNLFISGQEHYGWANVTYNPPGGTLTLFEMAYETTPNQGILTGAMPVPEPAETAALAALLAGSAAAFAARRKRRLSAAR